MEPRKEGANARAAIYTRISKDLTLEGLGITRQLKDCRALAERNGWNVVQVFPDNDISAADGKSRPEYAKLKAFMEAGGVDVVVVYSADRLHRNSRELEDWIDLASATGINIHSATNGHIDLSTPDGRTMARVITAFAANEVEKTKMRILRKHLELAEAGAWPGQKSYGYTAEAQIIPEEAAVIREMAARVPRISSRSSWSQGYRRRYQHGASYWPDSIRSASGTVGEVNSPFNQHSAIVTAWRVLEVPAVTRGTGVRNAVVPRDMEL
jgi:site-specific DNA recombinase